MKNHSDLGLEFPPDKEVSLVESAEPLAAVSPPGSRIRPLLDAVDKLRLLNIIKKGIQLVSQALSFILNLFLILKNIMAKAAVESASTSCSGVMKNHSDLGLEFTSDKEVSPVESAEPLAVVSPLGYIYHARIRPLLDAVDKLRLLNLMKEGIQLPTIVVVGDQSSGKSSVLESLAGISLPRGQGICTRVPLIMRLLHHASAETQLMLEFNGKQHQTNEEAIAEDIENATDAIAGRGKGISNTPLTLVVKKNGVPDLTMVDLPGITRVPVHGQPENIYEQIKDIIMEYIKPEASIILNVLSATVDFPTCESIRMSQEVDKTGERTLAVVTKADKSPEGLLEKVTADDVNIGLGYVCVRNRIGDESYEEARKEEARLFENHPHLSKIDKSIVGIPMLAQKLVQIQANIIARCLPDIIKKLKIKLSASMEELNKMPKSITSASEAMVTIMHVVALVKDSLKKILLRGEFEEYPEDINMHGTARLAEMLNRYSSDLHNCWKSGLTENFLMDEIKILEESKAVALPNFLSRAPFLAILQERVNQISGVPREFVDKVWDYIEGVVIAVLDQHSKDYHQLQSAISRASHGVIAKMKNMSIDWVVKIIEMEKLTGYTCNPEYLSEWHKLMTQWDNFNHEVMQDERPSKTFLEGFGEVEIGDLWRHADTLQEAFDLKMRITAYWKIVLRRLVDCMALHLSHCIHNLVDKELEFEFANELMDSHGGGIERMLEESPMVAERRQKLNRSVKVLMDGKEVVQNVLGKIANYAG